MLLADAVAASRDVAATSARLAKIERLAGTLARLDAAEVPAGVAYLSGGLPQGRLGVGYATLRDLVVPAAAPPPTLTIGEVDRTLHAVKETAGAGSQARRVQLLTDLLGRATGDEQDFLGKLLGGGLRQGALAGVMTEAIARAYDVPASDVRRAAMLSGDLASVAAAARAEGVEGVRRFRLQMFRPLQPMLAQTAEDVGGALERTGDAGLEWKLDGARIQVHRSGNDVRVYTRTLKEITDRVPEVVASAASLPVDAVILDGEAIALREDGRPHPFQVTMRRFGRRLDVEAMAESLPLSPFFFDCLHLDGDDLLDRAGDERFAALAARAPQEAMVPRLVTADPDAGTAFLGEALAAGHEGIVVKALDAAYEAGRRGATWVKVKPAHTLDLVVLAVEWGSGRRTGWLSNIHLGARDPASGEFVMLGKTFKGMTDDMLEWQTKRFLDLETGRDGHVVHVRPEQVVEIAFDGLQESPRYPGGLALRFARVKRYRDDKSAAEADTIGSVRAIYEGTS